MLYDGVHGHLSSVTLLCVLIGWLAVMSLVMLVSDAAPGALALFPSQNFIASLPADTSVVGAGRHWIMVRSDAVGLGLALYKAGTWFVLPAGLPGCVPLPTG